MEHLHILYTERKEYICTTTDDDVAWEHISRGGHVYSGVSTDGSVCFNCGQPNVIQEGKKVCVTTVEL